MSNRRGTCPKCGAPLDDTESCSICGYSKVKGISGKEYLISSSMWSSPSFSAIADVFGDDLNIKKDKNALEGSSMFLTDKTLLQYIDWGYLCESFDHKFSLTDLGKSTVKKNRESRGLK